MANFTVSPQGLNLGKVSVQGPIPGLYPTAATATFALTNTSGASVTITNYGFSTSTEGDAVTQPVGIYTNSDFTVVPTAGAFPVTVTNGSTQSFTVTYAPLRRGSGFGDIRSAILALFSGNKALTNGGQVLNSAGEVINESIPTPVTVGVGGGVVEESFDWPSTHPIMGMPVNFTLADMDTVAHVSPMMFFAAPVTGSQSETTPILFTPATYTTGSSTVPYAIKTPAINGSPRGGRSYQLLVFFADDTVTMNITIRAIAATHVVVATFTGINYTNAQNLFIGNNEGLDLQGLELTVQTTVTAGSSAYNIGAVITG